MKNIIFLLVLFFPLLMFPQKYDNNWMFGRRTPNVNQGANIHFDNNVFVVDSSNIGISMERSSTTMSDSLGNLQFYTNTYRVTNAQHQIMPSGAIAEGDTLNMSALTQYTSVLTLPHPSNSYQYYLVKLVYAFDPQSYIYAYHLKYCLIDMTADNGKGDVIQKNITILDDTLAGFALSSTKHANGKDWWIVTPEYGTKNYWISLLTGNGVQSVHKQQITGFSTIKTNIGGSSTFSPDGNLYIRYDQSNGGQMHIWHFDRCRGLLHTPLHFDFPKPANQGAWGVCVSTNNRYLYLCYGGKLVQFDLEATNILASQQIIYTAAIAGSSFNQIGLAPDGKMYLRAYFGNSPSDFYSISVIQNPNNAGLSCGFSPSSITLPAICDGLVPNYPNYRLGPLVCDTTSAIVEGLVDKGCSIYPNPTQDIVMIRYSKVYEGTNLSLLSLNGTVLSATTLPLNESSYTLQLPTLSAGIYIIKVGNQYLKLLIE